MPTGGSNAAMIVIFVIVGGFIAIAILGILSAIAIPNFLTAMQRSKQKRTMADMRFIGTALESYAVDNKEYPKATSIEELRPLLEPKYITRLPAKDGWEHEFRYGLLSGGVTDLYTLTSAGKDGLFEHEPGERYEAGTTTDFDNDIVYSSGAFVTYPEALQLR
jgi:type II secretory pathway pseudopilin PulG